MKCLLLALAIAVVNSAPAISRAGDAREGFLHPLPEARPWVYWYFMEGNMTALGMRHDLESMKKAGLGGGIFLEVKLDKIPRGPVQFMSDEWVRLLQGAIGDADQLGLQIALATGPGWCGDGGPWVEPDDAMQHLVDSETVAVGPLRFDKILDQPKPRVPFFGMQTLTPALLPKWRSFYRDVAVIAFPEPATPAKTVDVDEKALFFRAPFSSRPGVKPFLTDPADAALVPADQCTPANRIVDLTDKLDSTGRLQWDVPPGKWRILRLGRTLTGQTTRPAPPAGLGFETNKFDRVSLDHHFANYVDKVLQGMKPPNGKSGLTALHFDSWEMSSQNWSPGFRKMFQAKRGYDPLPYLPAMYGHVIDSPQITERFLWDLRQTAQEAVVENHAIYLGELAHQRGLWLSIEPYDLNPTADLKLGMAADVPMGEFWSQGMGFSTEYSVIEATSVGHTNGNRVIGAESFTSNYAERWRQYPGSMKPQADWALCQGINKFVFHRFQHQPRDDQFPGMTMGPYGVHWDRTQTWWDFVPAFHEYLSRCCQVLREGIPVADVLYLTPEGAPMVFRPPPSATRGPLQDRLGYNFDGCCPDVLLASVSVKDGDLVLPQGNRYHLLVLPESASMTPALLRKIKQLLIDGATVIGQPPRQSPSLSDYPNCDAEVRTLAGEIWGTTQATTKSQIRNVGKGHLILDTTSSKFPSLYVDYNTTASVLQGMGVAPDFESDKPVRYTHRHLDQQDIYFVANPVNEPVSTSCRFRSTGKPQWWQPLTGECRDLTKYSQKNGVTEIPLELNSAGSGFIVFNTGQPTEVQPGTTNFRPFNTFATIDTPWSVHFDPAWGGPNQVTFDKLDNWSQRPEHEIRGYSGKASYSTTFNVKPEILQSHLPVSISLGDVKDLASVQLNGVDLGVVWCAPWRIEIPTGVLKSTNDLQITVANLWINRLITDSGLPIDKQLTKTTWNPFSPKDALQPSGLLGPVVLQSQN